MAQFSSKSTPDADKLRGGYYTPPPIAEFIARWVSAAGDRLLEPSCGDGAILSALEAVRPTARITGIELAAAEAAKCRTRTRSEIVESDFFAWFNSDFAGTFDGVAGNPPYIRFGSWDADARERAMAFMTRLGIPANKLTNAWVPFVAASVTAARQGGHVGLVVPAELLQVTYATALRSFLVDNCSAVTIVSFEELVFPDVLQEVVLLLAVPGSGPAAIRTVTVKNASELPDPARMSEPILRAPLHDGEKWTKYYLEATEIKLLRRLRASATIQPFSEFAQVDVGVVTGRNSFFCMTDAEARERKLSQWTIPLISRSQQVEGLRLTLDAFASLSDGRHATRLLALTDQTKLTGTLSKYLSDGESEGVHLGYKCSIRKKWYVVPSVWTPDAFLLRQISKGPRLVANDCGATSTDTVHRVKCREGVDATSLAVAFHNSMTFAMTEIVGRSYGGGILELEPNEAEELSLPNPTAVTPSLKSEVAALLAGGHTDAALDLVDTALLVEHHGLSLHEVEQLRRIWVKLRSRRTVRGRSSR